MVLVIENLESDYFFHHHGSQDRDRSRIGVQFLAQNPHALASYYFAFIDAVVTRFIAVDG